MNTKIFHRIGLCLIFCLTVSGREPVRSLEDLRRLETRTRAVVDRVMPATVAIVSPQVGASGSGVIVDEGGLILTAAHVIDGAEEVEIIFADGKQTRARVLGSNYSKDSGMARIIEPGPWPHVELGASDPLRAGDWVVAMGHSEGYDPARTPPIRFGRVVSEGPGKFLTTDCTLIGGDSGGPVFDLDGKLVAINSSIGNSWENNNHAGIDGFKEDWERMESGESWGELQLNPLANPERPVIGVMMGRERRDGGVPVVQVTPGSPAAKAGMRPGDIIRAVGDERVRGGRSLQLLLAKFSAGDRVTIEVERGRQRVELSLELMRLDELAEELNR